MVSTRRSRDDEANAPPGDDRADTNLTSETKVRHGKTNSRKTSTDEEAQRSSRKPAGRKRIGSATRSKGGDGKDNVVYELAAAEEVAVEETSAAEEVSEDSPFQSQSGQRSLVKNGGIPVEPTETRGKAAFSSRSASTTEDKQVGNELTKLIPGYTAPLKLDTSSLDRHRSGLAELRRRAERTDASTAGFVVDATETHVRAMKKTSFMPTTYAKLYSSFKQGTKRAPDTSAGAGWFGMAPTPMTEELKTDLAVIRNRNYLDPKRFYKSADKSANKVMQLGTVIEGSAEFYSSRLTKKQRRTNLTEEIMADPAAADYAKNKYKSMQQTKNESAKKRFKKKLSRRQRRGY